MEIRPANQINEKFLFRNIAIIIFFLRKLTMFVWNYTSIVSGTAGFVFTARGEIGGVIFLGNEKGGVNYSASYV
jgi:hypothetical protein